MSGNPQTKTRVKEVICWKCGETYDHTLEECPDDGSRLIPLNPDDLDDPMIGSLFDGRFRIVRKLGEGGMGSVYAARQIDFERTVALKVLKADYLRDENIRKRFMYEARTISNLRHPNALRLYDFGQAPPNSFYMVMELLEGESLADRLAYRFLTYREILDTVPPICGVLGEAHENEVIHRDLKPENLYIVNVNGGEFPKLLDFGIAKHLSDETMTQSGTLWGTPAYMSPEQAKGSTVGAAADIYAIGIILYELICGNLPFHASTQMGLAMKHISVPARPLSSIPGLDSVPPELDNLILRTLSKDPNERPASMEELADALVRIRRDCFDDALLDSVPAEEVDAIELQTWIADEPDVEDEVASIPLDTQTQKALKRFEEPRVPTITAEHLVGDLSGEFVRMTKRRPMVGLYAALAVFAIAAGGAWVYATFIADSNIAEAGAANPMAGVTGAAINSVDANPDAEAEAPTSSAAGDAATTATAVVLGARNISVRMRPDSELIFVDAPEMVGKDGIAEKPKKKKKRRKRRRKTDARKVKNALENTF